MKISFSQLLVLIAFIWSIALYTISWWLNKPLDIAGFLIGIAPAVLHIANLWSEVSKNGNGNGKVLTSKEDHQS